MCYPSSNSAFQSHEKTRLLPSGGCSITKSRFSRAQHQCENTGKIGARRSSRRRCHPDKIPRWTRSKGYREAPRQTRSPGACRQV